MMPVLVVDLMMMKTHKRRANNHQMPEWPLPKQIRAWQNRLNRHSLQRRAEARTHAPTTMQLTSEKCICFFYFKSAIQVIQRQKI